MYWHKAAFADILFPQFSCKLIQSAKQIAVDLLQTFYQIGQNSAFKKGIHLCPALSVNGIFAVRKPVQKLCCLAILKVFCQLYNAFTVKTIGQTLLTVRGNQFQPVSGTNQFAVFVFELTFKPDR